MQILFFILKKPVLPKQNREHGLQDVRRLKAFPDTLYNTKKEVI